MLGVIHSHEHSYDRDAVKSVRQAMLPGQEIGGDRGVASTVKPFQGISMKELHTQWEPVVAAMKVEKSRNALEGALNIRYKCKHKDDTRASHLDFKCWCLYRRHRFTCIPPSIHFVCRIAWGTVVRTRGPGRTYGGGWVSKREVVDHS